MGDSGAVNSATRSIIWIRLAGTTIPAESQITIFMAFEPVVTEFDALYWRKAPICPEIMRSMTMAHKFSLSTITLQEPR